MPTTSFSCAGVRPTLRGAARRVVHVIGFLALPVGVLGAQTLPKQVVVAPAADAASQQALVINRIVAVVNDVPIMLSEVMDRAIRSRAENAVPPDSAQMVVLQAAALEDLIDEQVLLQKAKTEKVEIDDADVRSSVDSYVNDVRARFQNNDVEFAKALKESGFGSIEDYRKGRADDIRNQMLQRDLMGKLKQAGRIPAVPVTEADVTDEFERNKSTLPKRKASASLRQIIFPIEPSETSKRASRAKIDSIAKELLLHPEDFESIAKRSSMDGSAPLGGDLGWNRRGAMVPEFDRIMFALNPGIISPVVETQYGFHLIRVDRVQPSEVKARHILIKFTIDSTDEARALKLADSVAGAWRAGANYDTLVAKFHDNKNQEDRNIPDLPIDTMPISYQAAVRGHAINDIVGPFTILDERNNVHKPVIIQISDLKEAGDYTLPEWRQRIRAQLTDYRSRRRFVDNLRSEAYIWTYEKPKIKAADSKAP